MTRVKLDRSLIAGIDTSTRSQAIATAIISLCQGLGLEMTAEGVENRAQFAWLCARPAMLMQGYLLSPAVPAERIPELVAAAAARSATAMAEPAVQHELPVTAAPVHYPEQVGARR